jgi:hypothetical protein
MNQPLLEQLDAIDERSREANERTKEGLQEQRGVLDDTEARLIRLYCLLLGDEDARL